MRKNIIQEKTYSFSLHIVLLYKKLVEKKKEYVLSKQILRSGTSIGANVEEAIGGQYRKDFISKLSIAYKEARETNYWLKLLMDSSYLEKSDAQDIINACNEILKIIGSIQRTTKNNS